MALAPRADAALAAGVGPRADRRAVLAPRLAGARLRRARLRDVPGRRLERLVRGRRGADAGALRRLGAADAHRELGALVPRRRLPGAGRRLAARARAVLRPPPQRRRQRMGRRAGDDVVRADVGPSGAIPRGVAGPMAGVGRRAGSGIVAAHAAPGPRVAGGGHRGSRRGRPGGPPRDRRDVGWALVGRGLAAQRARGGPSPGRGARAHLHLGPARSADVDRRLSRGRPARHRDDAGRDLRRAAVRGVARRRLRARLDRRAEPDPPAVRRGSGADAGRSLRSSRGGADPAARDGVPVHAPATGSG